jgi:hypothetical protein
MRNISLPFLLSALLTITGCQPASTSKPTAKTKTRTIHIAYQARSIWPTSLADGARSA